MDTLFDRGDGEGRCFLAGSNGRSAGIASRTWLEGYRVPDGRRWPELWAQPLSRTSSRDTWNTPLLVGNGAKTVRNAPAQRSIYLHHFAPSAKWWRYILLIFLTCIHTYSMYAKTRKG